MSSTAFLGLPLTHHIAICFNYSYLTNFLIVPPVDKVSMAHSFNTMSNYPFKFLRSL